MEPIRINKYLRDKAVGSRRETDDLIAQGKVFVNGVKAAPGMLIKEGDKVSLKKGAQKEYVYRAYFKPKGLPTQGEKGGASVVTEWKEHGLYPIGRLDKESEGLLILTNDGRATEKILGGHFEKEYLVETRENLRAGISAIFAKGMETRALGRLRPAQAEITGKKTMLVTLHEGKHHQIRVMFAELGLTITALKRIRIGSVRLSHLKQGASRLLTEKERSSFFS
ncbi:MAG TPA: pseudouridine synthase [Candidatus Paceibacterota bacterium]